MSVAGDARLDKKGSAAPGLNGKGKQDVEWRGFINVQLNPDQKAQFDDWAMTGEPFDVLGAVVSTGCHVAVKINHEGGGFMASVTQRNPASVNAGLAVSARSGEAWKALYRVLFLIAVLGVEADWGKGQSPADPDRW